jgi:hypothetical protein
MTNADQQQRQGGGFARTIVKKALAPVVASAATAGTAYGIRKGTELWQAKIQPKLQERGGGLAVASETLEAVKNKLPLDSVKEKHPLGVVKAKLPVIGKESSAAEPAQDEEREQERRGREQRRQQRRESLEQARSS